MLRNDQNTIALNDREIDSLALFRSEWPSAVSGHRTDPVDALSLFPAELPPRLAFADTADTVPDHQHDDRAGDRRATERRKASNRLAQLCALLVRLDGEHEQLRKMAADLDTRRTATPPAMRNPVRMPAALAEPFYSDRRNARWRALIDAFTRFFVRPRLGR